MTKISFLAFFIVILLFSACERPMYFAFYQPSKVQADGDAKEWPVPLNYYDGDTKLQYTVSNDRQNIYICLKCADEKAQLKMIKGGVKIWIDTAGHNRNHVGIEYPMPNKEQYKKEEGLTGLKRYFLAAPREMRLAGFKAPLGGTKSIDDKKDICVAMNWDSLKTLVYEAIIPFKTFYKDSLSYRDSLKVFGISVTVMGLDAPAGEHGGGHSSGGNASMPGNSAAGSGMGGTRPGAMGGMGGQRRPQGGMIVSNPLYESNTVRTQIRLAVKERRKRKVEW